jgi:tRNA(Ile)-lysidine synthase
LRDGVRIGVAVSAGADSVALLLLLLAAREELREEELRSKEMRSGELTKPIVLPEFAVLHFHHGLRGRAADADQQFVEKLAAKHGVAFFLAGADVKAAAKNAKRNLEDAGRRERYAFFARMVAEHHVEFVATAHTMDDQAETVLAHMLRGTGLAGLVGIHEVSGKVLRPLLGVRRRELRQYLRSRKQAWREDATNRDTTRTRARIRKKLIPLLEKQFQPEVVAHLATLAERAREDEEFFAQAVGRKLGADVASRSVKGASERELRIRLEDLIGESTPPALGGRLVRSIIKASKQREGELGAQHVASVLQLARTGENGKTLFLPGGVEVRREKTALTFRARVSGSTDVQSPGKSVPANGKQPRSFFEHAVRFEGREKTSEQKPEIRIGVPSLMRAFRFTKIDWPRQRSETSPTGALVDCARLSSSALVLRSWRPGDRLQPLGRSNAHKLKRLLNEKGISRWERDGWPVLTSDGAIVWARGFPVAAGYAAGEGTTTAMLIAEEAL